MKPPSDPLACPGPSTHRSIEMRASRISGSMQGLSPNGRLVRLGLICPGIVGFLGCSLRDFDRLGPAQVSWGGASASGGSSNGAGGQI